MQQSYDSFSVRVLLIMIWNYVIMSLEACRRVSVDCKWEISVDNNSSGNMITPTRWKSNFYQL